MRQRKDFQRIEGVKSSRLIVIAAEGRATENIYFEAMRQELCATNVQLVVLNREDDNSNPANVHRQIKDFMDEYNILDDDQLWIVIDRDDWKEKMLADIAQLCQQNSNLRFCMSNPCFELWLILHLEDIEDYSEEDKKNRLYRYCPWIAHTKTVSQISSCNGTRRTAGHVHPEVRI